MSTLMASLVLGAHLVSAHVPEPGYYENTNPGVYVRADQVQVGVYRNSYRRTAAYVGYLQPLGGGEVMVGLATGYQRKCHDWTVAGEDGRTCQGFSRGAIAPMVAFTYAAPVEILGARPRLWAVPPGKRGAAVFHLTLEWTR